MQVKHSIYVKDTTDPMDVFKTYTPNGISEITISFVEGEEMGKSKEFKKLMQAIIGLRDKHHKKINEGYIKIMKKHNLTPIK